MRFGLICAFDAESDHILQEMIIKNKVKRIKTCFYQGEFHDHQVIFVIGGIGKVSSALCTQVLIDQFDVDIVVFAGIAGGINPDLTVGDTIIGVEVFYHDVDLAGQGIITETITSIFRNRFQADRQLIGFLKSELANRSYPLPPGLEKIRHGKSLQITFGDILTGDQMITSKSKVIELREKYAGDCVEMEGAAVAQTCTLNEKPFVILRTLSDLADEDAYETAEAAMESVVMINYQILLDVLDLIEKYQQKN